MILRHNSTTEQNYVNDRLKAVYSELLDMETQDAKKYAEWFLEKTKMNKAHIKELKLRADYKLIRHLTDDESKRKAKGLKAQIKRTIPNSYPDSLQIGDVIFVKYGVGIGDEFHNDHYAVVLGRLGSLFLLAPITSTPQIFGSRNITISKIGMSGKDSGHICYSQIRYVHYRRIEKITSSANGRLKVDPEIALQIIKNYNEIIIEKYNEQLTTAQTASASAMAPTSAVAENDPSFQT